MNDWRCGVVAVLLLAGAAVGAVAAAAEGALAPGDVLDDKNWQQAEGLLPPEILEHYKKGEYANPIMDWPEGLQRWGEDFLAGTKHNRGRLAVNERGTIIDKATGKQPPFIIGLPFPAIDPADPQAGVKVLWNYFYQYWYNGNSHNESVLEWLSPTKLERRAVQDVYFLYYDGQPRELVPKENPDNLLQQFLARAIKPADLEGTTTLAWRFRTPKRDLMWAYVPALRRVRQVSPANRSDGFLGSDMSQDDGPFFDGKPEDFIWKLAGDTEMLRFVDPYSLRRDVVFRPGGAEGGWKVAKLDLPRAGYDVPGWTGIAWAPIRLGLAKRKMWIVEATPKDRYYLYGRIQLYIEKEGFEGTWNRKFDWNGQLVNTYFNARTLNCSPDGKTYFSVNPVTTLIAENIRMRRATLAGPPPDNEAPFSFRVRLNPRLFNSQNLMRLGK